MAHRKGDYPYVQDIIARLLAFWAEKGCAVLQPLDIQVGAGTFHPATTLRALGPQHWHAAYVQPSRRPTDGRYGRHPNRLQRYYQLQVVQKPNPPTFQRDYLESLEMLGISSKEHDIRFMEDDWKSPILGAWGLGWEVWCDGMEITQFTYFQEVGGIKCKPVLGEITYGVERLAMYLQDIDNVYDLKWGRILTDGKLRDLTYGELYQDNERQQSEYNYSGTDTEELARKLGLAEKSCADEIEAGGHALVAYEAALECSHLFNLLDARGYFSADERNGKIDEIRDLTCRVAREYLSGVEGRTEEAD